MSHATKVVIVLFFGYCLIGCSPLNTQFSCNETAGDRCLSIEEVNAMTESKDEKEGLLYTRMRRPSPTPMIAPGYRPDAPRVQRQATQTIWVAPWTDANGVRHQDDTLFAAISANKTTL